MNKTLDFDTCTLNELYDVINDLNSVAKMCYDTAYKTFKSRKPKRPVSEKEIVKMSLLFADHICSECEITPYKSVLIDAIMAETLNYRINNIFLNRNNNNS